MKKSVKKTAHKTTRKISQRKLSSSSNPHVVLFRRVFLITTCLVLFVVATADVSKKGLTQSVAGISVAKGLFNQASVSLPNVDDVVTYNIYYKRESESEYTNAVRNISGNLASYTISYLKKNENYVYKVSAADQTGKEFYFSDDAPLTNVEGM